MDTPNKPRAQWSHQSLTSAVEAALMGNCSKKKAATLYGIPRGTLKRHIKKAEAGLRVEKRLGKTCISTHELEQNPAARILDREARLYGLTTHDIRRVVYKFCEQNKVKHKFSTDKQLAGKKWMQGFMKRHRQLSIRTPEKTSLERAFGFNRSRVQKFFDTLANQIFDENGSRRFHLNIFLTSTRQALPCVRRHIK